MSETLALVDFLLARYAEDEGREWWEYDRSGHSWSLDSRVLAECEAKRRIVKRLSGRHYRPDAVPLARYVLRTLALTYADHPDYREEWRP